MDDAKIQVDPVFSKIVGLTTEPQPSTSGCHLPNLESDLPILESDTTGLNHANLKPVSVFF
jgi:hypothetical protein